MSGTRADSLAANRGPQRARKACAHCRERKIKCDVTKRGVPCLNCEDANIPCIVKQRKNARNRSESATELAGKDRASEVRHARRTSDDVRNAENGLNGGASTVFAGITHANDGSTLDTNSSTQLKLNHVDAAHNHMEALPNPSDGPAPLGFDLMDIELLNLVGMNNTFFASEDYSFMNGHWSAGGSFAAQQAQHTAPSRETPPSSHMPALDYRESDNNALFGLDGNTSRNDADANADKQILSSQGCLSVPHPAIIRTLGLLYFEFVHPNLPILDEAEFWSCLSVQAEVQFDLSKFPLTVLQAMMFAATSFAPEDIALECGSSTIKAARMTFYRRAKLLVDLEYDPDPFRLSQAALLLTWHSPVANHLRVNSRWLLTAIHLARVTGADRFQELTEGYRKRILKRLWWGCILRDRIMPLGTRRAICIRDRVVQESDNRQYLIEDDFSDELGRSLVHDVRQQKRIFCMVNTACRLGDMMTPTLLSLFRTNSPGISLDCLDQEHAGASLSQIAELRSDLEEWRQFASCQFPYPVALGNEPQAVVIFANLLFIYFDTAIIHLCHKYIMTAHIFGLSTTTEQDSSKHITAAVDDITERTTEIVQLGLAKYTPISLGAYLPFPLLLHALNAHASSESGDAALCAQDRRKLNIFTRVLTEQRKQYEGSDFPCEVIDKIVAYANEQNITAASDVEWGSANPLQSKRQTTVRWSDFLRTRLRLYLRLAWHIDLAFCTSMAPREEDFPRNLR